MAITTQKQTPPAKKNMPRTPAGGPAPVVEPSSAAPGNAPIADTSDLETARDMKHFFHREDWWAAAATFLFSTVIFLRNMAPEVTLQDSGELVTGAFTFGVPHPPGYPLWALLGYIWSHLIVPFGNPAWRIGTMSVVTGGLTVGIMTLMMTRSIRVLLHSLPWSKALDERLLHWIALTVGVSSSLLFGFNRGVWLWASVSEMRVLNAFSFILIACTFFAWMLQPHRKGFLYATLLIYGLSMTNHQTVAVMALALVAGTLAVGLDQFFQRHKKLPEDEQPGFFPLLMSSLTTFWELSVAVLFSLAVVMVLFAWLRAPGLGPYFSKEALWTHVWQIVTVAGIGVCGYLGMRKGRMEGWLRKLIALAVCVTLVAFYWQVSRDTLITRNELVLAWVLLAAGGVAMGVGDEFGWVRPRYALLYTALFLAGCAFYYYMPIASATNPPMNWGYAATKEGFLHAIVRGQYEKLQGADPFGATFGIQIWVFVRGLLTQYSWPLCLFGLVTLMVPTLGLFVRTVKADAARQVLPTWAFSFLACAALCYFAFVKIGVRETLNASDTEYWILFAVPLCLSLAAATSLCVWLFYRRWMIVVWGVTALVSMIAVTVLRKLVLHLDLSVTSVASLLPPVIWGVFLASVLCLLIGSWLYLGISGRSWKIFAWAAFFASSLGLILIINPKLDRQEQEITIKFFAPAHGFFAVLIGYGIALTLGFVLWLWRRVPRSLFQAGCLALLALPCITYSHNWRLCALGTHDFGYQFGYRMFSPGGGYPDMEKDAVLYGGTDPGRFVPTYMIFCESRVKPNDRYQSPYLPEDKGFKPGRTFDRSDVYIITQNALADNTYMSYIRDHYDLSRPNADDPKTIAGFAPWRREVFKAGWSLLDRAHTFPKEPIRIPTPDDSTKAFQQFVDDWKHGKAPPGADISFEGGRVQVTGVQAVMAINGILAKWIFDWNKSNHAFYVEESYVIPWMYPYLTPAGVIMKIEKEPLPSPQQDRKLWDGIIAKDKAYWDNLTRDFTNREEFVRNADAKKSFSKMRSAIAGLYLWRGLVAEAEYAFRQSLQLCPESPEGCFRLADLYINLRRYDDARKLMTDYLAIDSFNGNVKNFLRQIDNQARLDKRRAELQEKMRTGPTINDVMELLSILAQANQSGEAIALAQSFLNSSNVPPPCILQLAQLFGDLRRMDLAQDAYRRYLAQKPQDCRALIDLGWTQIMLSQFPEAFASLRRAVEIGGEPVRAFLRKDPRFRPMWQEPSLPQPFRDLIAPTRTAPAFDLGF